MRTFEKTHPWLQFSADLSKAPTKLWIMLGECQSKCEHIINAPLLPETQKELLQVYLAKGALATTAIEGNTLTEQEVLDHLKGKLHLPPSKEYLQREIDNIVQACNAFVEFIRDGVEPPRLKVGEIKALNGMVLSNLELEDHIIPGEIREFSVGVLGYRGAPAEDCECLLESLCDWLNSDDFEPPEGMKIAFSIIKAILAHLYIAWIHPFGDGNGRTARLLEFRILISSGVPSPAAHLMSNHYNQTRTQYYRELKKASQARDGLLSFLVYAVQGFLDGLKQQIETVQKQQWDVVWRDFVYKSFRGKSGESTDRKRNLAFALSNQTKPVRVSEIPNLTPQLARAYANKTRKAVVRDLNDLIQLGIVRKDKKNTFTPRFEAISGFMSITAT
jgi:Fic family protein